MHNVCIAYDGNRVYELSSSLIISFPYIIKSMEHTPWQAWPTTHSRVLPDFMINSALMVL